MIIFLGIILILPFLIQIINVLSCKLAITNRRVIGKQGFLSTHSLDYPINKIDNVSVDQSFFGRIFSYAKITIKSTNNSANGSSRFASNGIRFNGISNANEFRNTLTDAIAKNEEDARRAQAEAIANAMSGKSTNN
jgi:uncharacterized membrane protein YdbT with pleckstrin-like domain